MAVDAPIVIIGGGWAGLAAAVELAGQDRPVCLLEARRTLGGRAGVVRLHGTCLDNGQHLLLGAYGQVLQLLDRLGIHQHTVFSRARLTLHMRRRGRPPLTLSVSRLPAPLHVLSGLLRSTGLSATDRWRGAVALSRFVLGRTGDRPGRTVAETLRTLGTPTPVIEGLLAPLCLAALNLDIEQADATLFRNTLRRAFLSGRSDSDLLIPAVSLESLVAGPAQRHLDAHGVDVRLRSPVTGLDVSENRVIGVWVGERRIPAAAVILCTDPSTSRRLLPPEAQHGFAYRPSPICTVYLKYEDAVHTEHPMVGLLGYRAQWLFDRSVCGQPGWIAAVISGWGPGNSAERQRLEQEVADDIAELYPTWPRPVLSKAVTQKQATHAPTCAAEASRPSQLTPIDGLLLAGDYTATGLPPTLEGAVHSGVECAKYLTAPRGSREPHA